MLYFSRPSVGFDKTSNSTFFWPMQRVWSRPALVHLAIFLFHSGWCGECRINAATAARIENKVFAGFALHELKKLRFCFFEALYCLDPQALAVWETSEYIEFVVHRPPSLNSLTPIQRQLAYQGPLNFGFLLTCCNCGYKRAPLAVSGKRTCVIFSR